MFEDGLSFLLAIFEAKDVVVVVVHVAGDSALRAVALVSELKSLIQLSGVEVVFSAPR